jgi:hypothetical protein
MLLFTFFILTYVFFAMDESAATKMCTNCKHFRLSPYTTNPENGQCVLFPEEENVGKKDKHQLITPKLEYKKCILVRSCETMCGKDGKYYECDGGNENQKNQFYEKIIKGISGRKKHFGLCPQ